MFLLIVMFLNSTGINAVNAGVYKSNAACEVAYGQIESKFLIIYSMKHVCIIQN